MRFTLVIEGGTAPNRIQDYECGDLIRVLRTGETFRVVNVVLDPERENAGILEMERAGADSNGHTEINGDNEARAGW